MNRRILGIQRRIRPNASKSHFVQISKSNDVIDGDTGRLFSIFSESMGVLKKIKEQFYREFKSIVL
jgi:hypothetical protein